MNFTHEISTSPNLLSQLTVISNIYLVAYYVNSILGLPVHSYVLWLICKGKGSGIVAEFFSLNLTICEILFCLTGLNYYLTEIYKAVAYIIYFSLALPCVGRPLINCVICIERYLAVLHPVSFLKYKPLRYRLVCSAVIWVIVIVFGVLFICVQQFENMDIFLGFYVPLYLILLSINLCCCLTIVRALKHPGPGEKGKELEKANHMKKNAITVILLITVTMFIQYLPLIFIGFLYRTVLQADLYFSIAVAVFFIFGYVSPILFIYRVRNHFFHCRCQSHRYFTNFGIVLKVQTPNTNKNINALKKTISSTMD